MDPKIAGMAIALQALGRVLIERDPEIARRIEEIADRFDNEAESAPQIEGAELAADVLRAMLIPAPS